MKSRSGQTDDGFCSSICFYPDVDLQTADSVTNEDEDNLDPDQGPWMPIFGNDQEPPNIPFTSHLGPRIHIERTAKPKDYFRLFLSSRVINIFVTETNRYAEQWIERNAEYLQGFKHSMIHKWIKEGYTYTEEIEAFISVIINMGLIKKCSILDYWDVRNPSQSTAWFIEHFNRDRFQILIKFLHFANNSNQPEPNHPDYRLYKVCAVVNLIKESFKKHYMPPKDIYFN